MGVSFIALKISISKYTIEKTYGLLVYEGFTQSKICIILKKSKSTISKITRSLEKAGYIKNITPGSRIKLYAATPRPLNIEDPAELFSIDHEKLDILYPLKLHLAASCENIESAQFDADLITKNRKIEIPTIGPDRFKKQKGLKGERRFSKQVLFNDKGKYSFVLHFWKDKTKLTIYTPHFSWKKSNGSSDNYVRELALDGLAWFSNKYKVECVNLKRVKDPHKTSPVRDPHLLSLIQNAKNSIHLENGSWIDCSKPLAIPMVEHDKEINEIIIERLNKIEALLTNDIDDIRQNQHQLNLNLDKFTSLFEKFVSHSENNIFKSNTSENIEIA